MSSPNTTTGTNTWMRIQEAIEESRSSRTTIRRMMDDGTLTAMTFRGAVLIDRSSFEAAFKPRPQRTA